MDPNANLRAQLRLAEAILKASDMGLDPDPSSAIELAERVETLNEWIAGGGFLPDEWRASQ